MIILMLEGKIWKAELEKTYLRESTCKVIHIRQRTESFTLQIHTIVSDPNNGWMVLLKVFFF